MNRRRPVSHRRVSTHRSRYSTSNPPTRRIAPLREGFQTKDLSGSFQGAGGVGGLLAVRNGGVDYYPAYDNNGNIVAYADASGAVVASYAYDAFGNTMESSGPLADFFAHRFSTKSLDPETSLYYYGYRFYAPVLGRWNNKDLLEEQGGWNLFSFCTNDPLLTIDLLGLQSEEHSEAKKCCCECIDSIRIELISNPNGQYVTNPEIGQLLFGHKFYVVVSISRGEADPESDYAPSLKWNEKITYSIGKPIQKEVISEHPESAQSQSWTNRTNLCEGSQDTTEIRIHDYSTIPIPPAYPEGQRKYFYRKVQFTFTGENSPSCSCKQPTVSQAATQTLSVINDAIATSSFVVGE